MSEGAIDPTILSIIESFFARPQSYIETSEDTEKNRSDLLKLALNYVAVWHALKHFDYDTSLQYHSSPDETPDRPGRVYKLSNDENEWVQLEARRLHLEYLELAFWKTLPLGVADQ